MLEFVYPSILSIAFYLYSEVPCYQKVLQVIKYFLPGLQHFLACVSFSKMISVLKAHRASAGATDGTAAPGGMCEICPSHKHSSATQHSAPLSVSHEMLRALGMLGKGSFFRAFHHTNHHNARAIADL